VDRAKSVFAIAGFGGLKVAPLDPDCCAGESKFGI